MKAAEGLLFDWAWPLFWLLATLAAYYAALRGRLEGRMLMGRRRRDKHAA